MSNDFFSLTTKYDKDWVRQNSVGANALHFVESLCEVIQLKKRMRVMDLGCGKAISSIFLVKEFDVEVWAVDRWNSPTENYKRIVEAGCGTQAFPIKADARNLPFPKESFDVVIAVDSYYYFGTDEEYLSYLTQFLKPNGIVGIVDACFTREIRSLSEVPEFLKSSYQDYWYSVHSVDWWKNLWEKRGLVKVICAEILPQSDLMWQQYTKDYKDVENEQAMINAVLNDKEKLIAFFRLVGQRTDKEIYLDYPEEFEPVQ